MPYREPAHPKIATPGICSQIAWESIQQDLPAQLYKVAMHIKQLGSRGSTADEIAVAFPEIWYNSVASTMVQLHKRGYIVNSRVTRRTRTGRPAIVWVSSNP